MSFAPHPVMIFLQISKKIVLSRCQIRKLKCTKLNFGLGFALDPTRGTHIAPQTFERKGRGMGKGDERGGKGEKREEKGKGRERTPYFLVQSVANGEEVNIHRTLFRSVGLYYCRLLLDLSQYVIKLRKVAK